MVVTWSTESEKYIILHWTNPNLPMRKDEKSRHIAFIKVMDYWSTLNSHLYPFAINLPIMFEAHVSQKTSRMVIQLKTKQNKTLYYMANWTMWWNVACWLVLWALWILQQSVNQSNKLQVNIWSLPAPPSCCNQRWFHYKVKCKKIKPDQYKTIPFSLILQEKSA